MKLHLILLNVLLLSLIPYTAEASTAGLYVSTLGSDANPCTIDQPCQSFSRATLLSTPGDTVHVESGIYPGYQVIFAEGTSDQPITVQADGPVTITSGYQPYCLLCVWDQSHDVIVRGFTLVGSPVDPAVYNTPSLPMDNRIPIDNLGAILVRSKLGHVVIDHNTVLNSPATCIKLSAPNSVISSNVLNGCGSDFWTHGIYVAGPDVTVISNTVSGVNYGFGIHFWGTNIGGARITDNLINNLGTKWTAIVVGGTKVGDLVTTDIIARNVMTLDGQKQRAAIMLWPGLYRVKYNKVLVKGVSKFKLITFGYPPAGGIYDVQQNLVRCSYHGRLRACG